MLKKTISILLALLILASCSSTKTEEESVHGCDVLKVYNAGEYVDEEILTRFEDEYDVSIKYSIFLSNEEMYTQLLGGTVYDVMIPSDYMIEKLQADGLIQKIDKSKITNIKDLYDGMLTDYDPDFEYSVPYFWGNVGIIYDSTKIDQSDVESQGWEVLRNPKYKGLIYMYDSERDSFMVALKALGYSMNTTDEKELEDAYNWLIELDNRVDPSYVTDEIIDGLAYASEGKYMGVVYSGDAAYISSENENMKYWAPKEGTNYWTDAMVIHKKSECAELAHEFMNFMIDHDNAYDNSLYVGYSSPNKDALKELEEGEYADNEAYSVREITSKDEVFHNNDNVRKIISDYWTHVKLN